MSTISGSENPIGLLAFGAEHLLCLPNVDFETGPQNQLETYLHRQCIDSVPIASSLLPNYLIIELTGSCRGMAPHPCYSIIPFDIDTVNFLTSLC
jgi:hypothetical protein